VSGRSLTTPYFICTNSWFWLVERPIILSWGLERSFGDKLAITLSRNFVSVCNFMTVNDFYTRYGTLPHTFSHFCHTLGSVRKCEKVTPNLCVKKSGKKSVRNIRKQSNKKIHFFEKFSFPATPREHTVGKKFQSWLLKTLAVRGLEERQNFEELLTKSVGRVHFS
jgi:hypothetical protein